MSSFYKRFNLESPNQQKVEQRFINRAINTIYGEFLDKLGANNIHNHYYNFFHLALANYHGTTKRTSYIEYHGYDFHKNLISLEAIYNALPNDTFKMEFSILLEDILSLSEIDSGVIWRDGKFYPSGAKVLDEALVNDVLDWLDDDRFTNVKAPFQKALSHYLESTKKPELLADVITDMYEALEAFAKVVTEKDRDLSKNRELFIKKLNLSAIYKKMLKDYIEYANEYRHGLHDSRNRTIPKEQEVEAFIYQTGLFIRLGIKSLE